jgi:hypothetical protein
LLLWESGGLVLKARWCDYPKVDFLLIRQMLKNTLNTAKMVNMAVGEQNRANRLFPQVFTGKQKGFAGRFPCGKRVHKDPASATLDDRHIGQIVTPDLVNPLLHFEQTVDIIEGRLSPEAGINRGGSALTLTVNKGIARHVPDLFPIRVGNHQIRILGNQAAVRVLEVFTVIKGSLFKHLLIGFKSAGCRRAARRRWLRVAGASQHHIRPGPNLTATQEKYGKLRTS